MQKRRLAVTQTKEGHATEQPAQTPKEVSTSQKTKRSRNRPSSYSDERRLTATTSALGDPEPEFG